MVIPYEFQVAMIAGSGGAGKFVTRALEGSGHSPLLSKPEEVAKLVREIVDEWGVGKASGEGKETEGGIAVDDIIKLARS